MPSGSTVYESERGDRPAASVPEHSAGAVGMDCMEPESLVTDSGLPEIGPPKRVMLLPEVHPR